MDLIFGEKELWCPSCQKLDNSTQIDDHVKVVLETATDLWMHLKVRALQLLKDHEHLRCDVIERVKDLIHKLV